MAGATGRLCNGISSKSGTAGSRRSSARMKSGEPRTAVLPIGVRAWMAVIAGGITVVGALLLPRRPAVVPLSEQRMRVDAEIDEVFQRLTSFDQGPTVVERNGNELIAHFPVAVGVL